MDTTLADSILMTQQNAAIAETFAKEKGRLRNFIRQRVPDPVDADDILQDVFYEFISAYRLPEPLEQVGAWLYRVARNRIIDRFRKQKNEAVVEVREEENPEYWLETVLPANTDTPEAIYERKVLVEKILLALNQLPSVQRSVFIAHELEGRSFKEISAASGAPINTLLARKRYAILYLREQLQATYQPE
jgi:RNA polymerase sigma factor (sigma-70 family)